MGRRALCVLLLAALLTAGCSSSDPVAVPEIEPESDVVEQVIEIDVDLTALDSAFDEWAEGFDGGGVGLVQFEDGSVHLVDAGEDAATAEPLSAEDDLVRVGSISKVFTATLVLQLVDEGLVELDQPVATYVPAWSLDDAITVRQLLAHESGIPNYTEDFAFMGEVFSNPELESTPLDVLAVVEGEADFRPGSQFSYSNSNYVAAGLLVEAVTGQMLNEALEDRIAEPLNLTETRFDDGTLDGVAAGYTIQFTEGQTAGRSYQSVADVAWAAGSMITTVSELAMFFNALYVDNELISAELMDEMLDGLDGRFEYGLGTHAGPDFGLGHGGSIIGFNSIAEVDPDTGEMIIVVVNNDAADPVSASAALTEVAGFG